MGIFGTARPHVKQLLLLGYQRFTAAIALSQCAAIYWSRRCVFGILIIAEGKAVITAFLFERKGLSHPREILKCLTQVNHRPLGADS